MTLYIHCKATRYHNFVDLVTECGAMVARVYSGDSRLRAFQAVQYWRCAGYQGYVDPYVAARSTSGGNGKYFASRFYWWDNIERYGKGIG